MIRKNYRTSQLFLLVVIFTILVSCDPARKYEKEEKAQIDEYLATVYPGNFELKKSGLYYLETLAGTGISPVIGDSAFINYKGTFLNGNVFDPGPGTGKVYGLLVGNSITGFDEGLMLSKEGGKATLLIPSKLGYGGTGSDYYYDPSYGYYQTIPGYTPLLFDIELVRVVPKSK
jgi:FKBP-type peptidyl-prolyl cis-trans isomerase